MNFILLYNYWVTSAQGIKDKELIHSSNNYQTSEQIVIIDYQEVLLITCIKVPWFHVDSHLSENLTLSQFWENPN